VGCSWLLDSRLDDARVGIHQCMLKMKQCEEWSNEADAWWLNLQALESTNALMATQLFSNDRRSVGASTLALSSAWTQLSNELQVRLNHLQKVGGRVLDDRGSQATGCQLPGWPPVPAARAAAAGEDDAPVGVSRHDSEDSISTSASSSPSGCADDDADGSRSAKAVFLRRFWLRCRRSASLPLSWR